MTARAKAVIPVDGASHIKIAMSEYGVKEALFISGDEILRISPAEGTPEAGRTRFDAEHPRLSLIIAIASWTIVALSLVLEIPQWAEFLLSFTDIRFTSPWNLSVPLNLIITAAGILAGIEAALRTGNLPSVLKDGKCGERDSNP